MRRWVAVLLCVLAVLLLGCSYPRWRVTDARVADEEVIFTVCPIGGGMCLPATLIPGTGRLPKVGMVGWQVDLMELEFPGRYGRLYLHYPTPV